MRIRAFEEPLEAHGTRDGGAGVPTHVRGSKASS